MLKPLAAAVALLALAGLPASASTAPGACVNDATYKVQHNPVRPLPSGGGGGEPHTPVPGDPVGYVKYDVAAVTAAAKCIAG